MRLIRWLGRNTGSLVLAFVLALVVWISAVNAADPNEERDFSVDVELRGQPADMDIIGDLEQQINVTLFAPRSILDQVEQNNRIEAWVVLSGVEAGTHNLPVLHELNPGLTPVREISALPESIEITLEALITRTVEIERVITGEPALGYQLETAEWSATKAVISGRSSYIDQVTNIAISLDVTGIESDLERTFSLLPIDENGSFVPNVTIEPQRVNVLQPVTLLGGYRNVVVRVLTSGQVADGYRTTNITPTPLNVMVFSPNPELVLQLPGYIETEMLDLTAVEDDVETFLALNLPNGITVIGDPNILVQVGIAALYNSLTLSIEVELIGLLPGFEALASPNIVDVLIYGPIPVLETLRNVDVRVVIDLTGFDTGVYQLNPAVEILPDQISLEEVLPEKIEIIISQLPTQTISPTTVISPTVTVQP